MRRILVLRGGALGDFLVTLPALAALRARWPAAQIELAGNATAAQLAIAPINHPASPEAGYAEPVARLGRAGTKLPERPASPLGLINVAYSQHEARWLALFGPAPLPAEFGAWLAAFDLVVSWWPDPDEALRAHFPRHAGQVFLAGEPHPRIAPAAAHYAATLRPLGLEAREWFVRLTPEPAARTGITVHPGSGSPRKNWPRDRWLALLTELPAPVTLVLGEAELARGPWPAPPGVTVLRQPPLESLAAHLTGCRLFLGHDSGVSHLAAACGAPCVLLFGPTDPAMWAPPAPQVRVIKPGETMEAIAVADVRALL